MMSSLLFAPLNEFFERVPIGRILNRISKDIQTIDGEIAYSIRNLLFSASTIIGDTFLCLYASSLWVLIPVLLFFFAAKKLQNYYMNAQRELVRLETISRSPIIHFFAEVLEGLPSIRAFNQQMRFQ